MGGWHLALYILSALLTEQPYIIFHGMPEDFADIINDMGAVDYIHLKYEERGRAAFGKRLK